MRDEEAVSDVVGTMLMLVVTMAVFGGLAIGVLAYVQAQPHAPRASLAVNRDTGSLLIANKGGESVAVAAASVRVNVAGTMYTYPASRFPGAASLGTDIDIGESLCVQGAAPSCIFGPTDDVRGAMLVAGNSALVLDGDIGGAAGCSGADTQAPTVTWTQSPANVQSLTTGSVAVTATLADCSGVDVTVAPTLWWSVDLGTPAYQSAGPMTRGSGMVWTGAVPAQAWSTLAGKTLHYAITGQADLAGHAQSVYSSPPGTDVIESTCPSDTTPPTVSGWTQSPGNLLYNSSGAVTVTATLTDDCFGVDQATTPVLWYRLDPGSHPAYTSLGSMAKVGTSTWRATIPSQTWSALKGQTLNYYLVGQRDLGGNVQSAVAGVQADYIDPGVADPGTSFVDANGDGLYTAGVDTTISAAQVTDGAYDAGTGALILPPSLGPISASTIAFSGSTVTIDVPLTSTSGTLSINAATNVAIAPGTTLSSQGSISVTPDNILSANGTTFIANGPIGLGDTSNGHLPFSLYLQGTTLDNTASSSGVTLRADAGTIDLTGATVRTKGAIDLGGGNTGHPTAAAILNGATLDNTAGTSGVTASGISGAISATGARILSKGPVSLAAGTSFDLSGSTVDNSGGATTDLTLTAGTAVTGTNAKLAASGRIQVTGVGVSLNGACATTTGSNRDITLGAGSGALSATGPSTPAGCTGFASTGAIALSGASITVTSGRFVTAAPQSFSAASSAGAISAASATVTAPGGQTWSSSGGGITVQGATLSSTSGNLVATVPSSGGYKVTVTSASFTDANNKLKVNPNNTATYVTGTPASGGTE